MKMTDLDTVKMAKLLTDYSTHVQNGDLAIITGDENAMPLYKEFFRCVFRAGGYPHYSTLLPGYFDAMGDHPLDEIFLLEGNDDQLRFISPLSQLIADRFDVVVIVLAPQNLRTLSRIKSNVTSLRSASTASIMDRFSQRMSDGTLKRCVVAYPTNALAQQANMSLNDYSEFLFKACHLNDDDPGRAWQAISRSQEKIIKELAHYKKIRIIAEDTDLKLSVEGRTWLNCDGKFNMPDGEIFTGPVEDSVKGHIKISFPGILSGQEIENIHLFFENGKVVSANASSGEDLLKETIKTDSGAGYLGEVGIGTNYQIHQFTQLMLFDEKIGGTIHIALGEGYSDSGSKNTSGIHWDMLCDLRKDGEIHGDDEVIYRNGKFLF
jgi:aminopeptidase